jgi:hypothetical protein
MDPMIAGRIFQGLIIQEPIKYIHYVQNSSQKINSNFTSLHGFLSGQTLAVRERERGREREKEKGERTRERESERTRKRERERSGH